MARPILLCLILYVAVADSGILTKDLHWIQDLESRDGCEMLDRFDSDVQCKGNVHDVFSVAGQVMTMADTGTVCRAGFTLDFFACKGGLWVQVPVSFARSLKRREDQHHREKRFWGTVGAVIGAIGGVVDIFCTFLCDNGGGGGGGPPPNTLPQIDCPYVGPQYAKTGDTMVVTWTEPTGTDTEDGSLSPKRSGLAPGSVFTASTHFIKYRVVDSGGLSADCEILFSVHTGCSTGTYVEAGSGNCVSCPVGTYTDEGFSDACKLCGEGKSTRSTESRSVNDCIDTCTEGSFSMDGMAPCTPCSPGTYQDAVAMTSCTSCPTGTTSPQGSHNASSCVAFDLKVHANTETVFGNISSDLSALTLYFWCHLDTSLGHTLARITDTDRNTVMELSITNNVFLNIQGNSVDTGVTPATNRWQHLALTLDGSSKNIALYLNGIAVYSDNMASLTTPLAPRGSSVAIVSGNGGITQSGINIIERVASLDDIQAQSSSCVSTLQESVLTFIKNGTNLIVPSQCDAVDDCLDNPCGSHPCKDDLEGFTCDCQDSWTGVTCDVPPDYCAHHECQNNAICENGNGNYTCQCLKGFKGELCQELVVNGNWGDWSKKTECSASCGGGNRSRSRQCDSPPPDVDGDTCDGASEETEQCNTDACPECPTLRLSSGNLKNCTQADGYTRCTITCRGDMVFSEKPLPVYECGAGSDYVWNHQEHKSNARPPACRTAMGAARYDVTHTVTYQDLPCSSGNTRSDEIKSQVSGNIDVLPCVQESICTTSVSINNCNNNGVSKRSTTSTVVLILISTIMGDSASLDLTEFVENNIVTTGLTNYLNKLMKTELSVQTLVNSSNTLLPLTIDGATYQVDTNSMSTTSLAICPSGTTPTEGVCGQCPPGTKEVSGKCVLCEKGTYQHEAASASCRRCPSSTTTPGVGAEDVSQCTVTDEEADSEHDHEPQWKLIAIGLSCIGGACFIAVAVIIVVKKKGYYKIQKSSSRPSTAGSFHKMFHHRVSVASLPPPYSQEEPQMPPSSTSAFRTQMLVMEAPEMRARLDPLPPLKCTFQYTPGTKII
ncbi:uncharacterized protein [Haliotis cracherodii]|uniref:uncharacterized protein n=1 Tax=Haliotis cracherodii TaxID=6455 RepID=UPI0039E9E931